MTHFTKILIIIALTTNNSCTISTDGKFLFQKKVKFEVLFTWLQFFFKGKKLSKTIFAYLKNLFSLISGFQFPVSGFWFLFSDSRFRFLGFRVA